MRGAIVLAALLTVAEGTINYCGAKMCGRTNEHTFCKYHGPGSDCMGYIEDRLTHDERSRVLARLNRRRSEAAAGKLSRLPTAGNMLKLRWVEELAREAQLWADQCQPPSVPEDHDDCRDLFSITVGQCVASVIGEAPGLRPESIVDTWYLQGLQYKGNVSSYTSSYKHADFGQMVWAHSFMVGCARSRFMSEANGRTRTVIRLVCNFAPRGPAGELWLPAAPAAACPQHTQPDDELPSLCTQPQTALELQEALEHVEKTLAGETSGKVRRELRRRPQNRLSQNELSQDYNQEENLEQDRLRGSPRDPREDGPGPGPPESPIRTLDKTPTLNMIIKYLPFIKDYEKMMSPSSSISPCVVIIFVTVCLSLGLL